MRKNRRHSEFKRIRLTTTGKNGPTSKAPYRYGPPVPRQPIGAVAERNAQIDQLLEAYANGDDVNDTADDTSDPAPEHA